jgi:hypothetical protein
MAKLIDNQQTQAMSPEVTTQPTRTEVAGRIVAECTLAGVYCRTERAKGLLRILRRAAKVIGEDPYEKYYFTQSELDRYHEILDVVMPDNWVRDGFDIPEGSAHAGINAIALAGRQLTFEHTKAYYEAQDFCVVETHVRIV